MADAAIKVELGAVPETLLIPLAARATARETFPELGFSDPKAEAIAARLDADPARFTGDAAVMRGCIARAGWFDEIARRFLARHPDGLVVCIGAGLDARAERVSPPATAEWIDLELEEVARLRAELLPDAANIRTLTADATRPSALFDKLGWEPGRPALFLSEGVLMYLRPGEPEQLFAELGKAADTRGSKIELAFDYSSPLMVKRSRQHPSVRKTSARFGWSLTGPRAVQAVDPAYELLDHTDHARLSGWVFAVFSAIHRLTHSGDRFYGLLHFRRAPNPLVKETSQ